MCNTSSPAESIQATSGWTALPSCRKFIRTWQPATTNSPTVLIVHGLGEHSGRYHNLGRELAARGLHVFSFDQQGHGESPEARGCVRSYDSLLDDIGIVMAWVRETTGQLPTLLGHSMGGNLVLNYAMRRPQQPRSVISSSPMIEAVNGPSRTAESVLRVLCLLLPNFRLRSTVRAETLMSDPVEQDLLRQDDVFHSQISLRLGAGLIDSGRWLLAHASDLSTPTLLVHGENDCRTCPQASARFAKSTMDACRFELLNGHMHDPFRDQDKDDVIDMFASFIQQTASQ